MKNKRNASERVPLDAARTRKLVTAAAAAVLAAVLMFLAVIGGIGIYKRSSYVMYCRSGGIDEGAARCLASYYKAMCIRTLNYGGYEPSDTEKFWSSVYDEENGITFGDYLRSYVERSLGYLLAAEAVFDKAVTLAKDDTEKIEKAISEKITYGFGGDKNKLAEEALEYGFNYKGLYRAVELLYKQAVLGDRIFGEDGADILADIEYCEEFFASYHRVKFIFIRTDKVFYLDEDGNRVIEDGAYKMRYLTESELAERLLLIDEIKGAVDEINEGERDSEAYESYALDVAKKYGEISSAEYDGYYLKEGSAFTAAFLADYPDMCKRAMALEIGEGDYFDFSMMDFEGVCFMYRDEPEMGSYIYYTDSEEDGFFHDFTSLAASARTSSMIEAFYPSTEVSDKWQQISLTDMPYTTKFIPSLG